MHTMAAHMIDLSRSNLTMIYLSEIWGAFVMSSMILMYCIMILLMPLMSVLICLCSELNVTSISHGGIMLYLIYRQCPYLLIRL